MIDKILNKPMTVAAKFLVHIFDVDMWKFKFPKPSVLKSAVKLVWRYHFMKPDMIPFLEKPWIWKTLKEVRLEYNGCILSVAHS